jgi:hypothetical protein
LANTSSSPATTVYVATLPVGFSAISCMSPAGSCVIGTGTQVSPANDPDGLRLKSNPFAASASQTVTWSGAIPGNGSVTISYQVQVSVQATGGTQYCVTSTIGGATGPSSCLTVNALSAGPGNPPIFAGLPNTQKPASILIFNLYTSSVSSNREETQISLDQHQSGQSDCRPSLLYRRHDLHDGRSDRHPDPESDGQLHGERYRSGSDRISDRRGD